MSTLSRCTFALLGLLALAATEAWENEEFALAMEKHRKLQANPDGYCLEAIGGLVQCYAENCFTEFCEVDPGVVPDPPADAATDGCDELTDLFCMNFQDQCCPACAGATQAYIDCIVDTSFLGALCPGSTCGNTTAPNSNTTVPENNTTTPEPTDGMGTPIPDAGMAGFDMCVEEMTEVFGCYFSKCFDRSCDSELGTVNSDGGTDDLINNCGEYTVSFCAAFDDANTCCPECANVTTAYSVCALQQWVTPYCADATCEDKGSNVATSKGGPVSRTVNDEASAAAETGSSSKPSQKLANDGTELESGSVRLAASSALALIGIVYLVI